MINRINIKDFGAVGDGKNNDTVAINNAIRFAQKDDTVFVPDGKYNVSTIKLKSDITLELSKDAVLIGSSNINDYYTFDFEDGNRYFDKRFLSAYGEYAKNSLLYLFNLENVKIIGGTITFDDLAFDKEIENNAIICDDSYISGIGYFRKPKYSYVPKSVRPVGIYISNCNNISIYGTYLLKSPMYSVWVLNSFDLLLDGIVIKNSKYQWNGDGVHFSSCRDVEIKNCDITASDDCIAVDGNYGKKSYNYFIHDSKLFSTIHIFRFFTGLDFGQEKTCENDFDKYSVNKIVVENCKVSNGVGLLLICAFDGNVSDITLNNIDFNQDYEGTTISLNAKAGTISNVDITNCNIKANGIGYCCQQKEGHIKNINISNCVFLITPKTKMWGIDFPEGLATHTYSMPYNFICKNVEKMVFSKTKIKWNKAIFSNELKNEDKDGLLKALGVKKLKELEPNEIKAIINYNSNICVIDSEITDYKNIKE